MSGVQTSSIGDRNGTKGATLEMEREQESCIKLAYSCLLCFEFVLKAGSGSWSSRSAGGSAFHCSASPSLSESRSANVNWAVSP